MKNMLQETLEANPLIAAVKSSDELAQAINSPVEGIFLLGGNICELQGLISAAGRGGKNLYVHVDLIEGIGKDCYAVRYIKEQFAPDGIITTKSGLVKYAKECGISVIQRLFMLDSMSFEMGVKAARSMEPDAVEILPGIMPHIIEQIHEASRIPIIAGGLIRTKQEAVACLGAGAMGVSTSCKELWYL